MPPRKSTSTAPIYQLKVTLKGSKPPIWRRIQVPGDISLARLHDILQIVMGWTDSHLHQFIVGEEYYGVPDKEFDMDMKNEGRAKLNRIAPAEKSKFAYEYDFGDSWEHEILVEKILPREADVHYPRALTGKRACPPEDCGGIWGYADFLEAIRDPNHPQHDELVEWIGEDFDPEDFDLEGVNQILSEV